MAEDDEDMRALVVQALRGDGHDVTEVVDGARLLVRIAHQYRSEAPAEHIDLIISDLRMPVLTGFAVLRGLRAAHCRTPVILMTGFSDDKVRQEAAELEAIVFDKPFLMADLRRKVRELLTGSGER